MSERPRLPSRGIGRGRSFEFDIWLSIGDEALETKGLAKAGSRFIPVLEADLGLRGLENLGLMFALRDVLAVCI